MRDYELGKLTDIRSAIRRATPELGEPDYLRAEPRATTDEIAALFPTRRRSKETICPFTGTKTHERVPFHLRVYDLIRKGIEYERLQKGRENRKRYWFTSHVGNWRLYGPMRAFRTETSRGMTHDKAEVNAPEIVIKMLGIVPIKQNRENAVLHDPLVEGDILNYSTATVIDLDDAQIDAVRELIVGIGALIKISYENGFEKGRNLLTGLAEGSITTAAFDAEIKTEMSND